MTKVLFFHLPNFHLISNIIPLTHSSKQAPIKAPYIPNLKTMHNKADTPTVKAQLVMIEVKTGNDISPAVSNPLT